MIKSQMSQFKSETLQTLVDRLLIETNTSTYEVARKSKGAISQSMLVSNEYHFHFDKV